MFTYTCGGITDKGDIRKENQDSILYLNGTFGREPAALAVLADGMGGLSYGAQVSHYITEQFQRWWQEDFPDMIQAGFQKEEDIRELLEQQIWDINQDIYTFNGRENSRSGSTLSLLLLYGKHYFIENIGDSRVYLFRHGQLFRLTRDQSVREQREQNPYFQMDEKKYQRVKDHLTMCIGMFQVPQSQYVFDELFPEDLFLVCSDGLHKPLSDEQIQNVLAEGNKSVWEQAEALRQSIRTGRASDNVSVILLEAKEKKGMWHGV